MNRTLSAGVADSLPGHHPHTSLFFWREINRITERTTNSMCELHEHAHLLGACTTQAGAQKLRAATGGHVERQQTHRVSPGQKTETPDNAETASEKSASSRFESCPSLSPVTPCSCLRVHRRPHRLTVDFHSVAGAGLRWFFSVISVVTQSK